MNEAWLVQLKLEKERIVLKRKFRIPGFTVSWKEYLRYYQDERFYTYEGSYQVNTEEAAGDILTREKFEPHTSELLSVEDFVRDGLRTINSCYSEEFCYLTDGGQYRAQIGNFSQYTHQAGKRGHITKSDDGNYLERFHFFDETRSTIPRNIIFMKNLYSSYDYVK